MIKSALPDTHTQAAVQRRLEKGGAQRATARQLGVSRETALAIALGLKVTPGSLALVRERLRALEDFSE